MTSPKAPADEMDQGKAEQGEAPAAEKEAGRFVEGVHFYREGEFVVFTARAHLERGYCCGSGCRHCPYRSA
jgi:hypothetical protein